MVIEAAVLRPVLLAVTIKKIAVGKRQKNHQGG